ncbi:hypothetical protein MT391_16735 [Vibrio sp. 1-Bac 57]
MLKSKVYASELIIKAARKAPLLFPKWLVENICEERPEGFEKSDREKTQDGYKTASFLEGDFNWKAIAVTVRVSESDIHSMHRWMKKHTSNFNYVLGRFDDISPKYTSRGNENTVGWVQYNKPEQLYHSLMNVEDVNSYCKSCYVSISTLSKGFSYLNLYFFLTEKATSEVHNVNVEHIKKRTEFYTLNPFSKQFKILNFYDRTHLINKLINQRMECITSNVVTNASDLLKIWGIRKSNSEFVVISDIYRNNESPYFSSNRKIKACSEVFLIEKYFEHYDLNISEDTSESFCQFNKHDEINTGADAIYIKSQLKETFVQHEDFSINGMTAYNSHLVIALLIDCQKQYRGISARVNSVLLDNSKSPESNHKTLFKALLDLNKLNENLTSTRKIANNGCRKKYSKFVITSSEYLLKLTEELIDSVKIRKESSRDDLEVKNIQFHKWYAGGVGLLVVVQIIIGVLSIDWKRWPTIKGFFEYLYGLFS